MSSEVALLKSTHRVEVVPVVLTKHPSADRLSVVKVFGYTVVVGTSGWEGKTLGAYIPPDSLVDTVLPEFAFLKEKPILDSEGKCTGYRIDESITQVRIKAKKLRGIWSQGMLVPAPEGSTIGDDVTALFKVIHYDPPIKGINQGNSLITGSACAKPPLGVYPKYDVDSWRRYKHLFVRDESVWVFEKLHGCNARYLYKDGEYHCGSRTEWKKQYPTYDHLNVTQIARGLKEKAEQLIARGILYDLEDEMVYLARAQELVDKLKNATKQETLWWKTIRNYPMVLDWLKQHEGYTLYGEVYGQVQDLKYGTKPGETRFAAFDILAPDGRWLDMQEALSLANSDVPWVPCIGRDY